MSIAFRENKHFIEGTLATLECSYGVLPYHGSIEARWSAFRISTEFYRLDEMRQMYITEQDLKNRSKRHPPTPSASSRKHK
ncbi:unnamed protein product [Bemisia tabaci]|uniref:Uncharacterized protein n=1 Tax=Bemisia tabaci TaxID=7038 RepID=A0A9P0AC54_BEMTA|nr:unnamed protein product [Bemisia tabaci]